VLAELDDAGVEAGHHVVQFYEGDASLALAVGGFLGDGLVRGETALVVATPAHRALFEAALRDAGLDVDALRVSGALRMTDAQHMLDAFTVGGVCHRDLFDESVGALVAELVAEGRPVRIYGEMVALLWDAGHVAAAIELEETWNALQGRTPFTLFCAYPKSSLGDTDGPSICRTHSAVVPDPTPLSVGPHEVSRRFEPTPYAVPAARRFVRETLHGWGRPSLFDVSDLIISELAGNAVRHSSRRFLVRVTRRGAATRIAVSDQSSVLPTVRAADPDATNGRGLHIIAAVSMRWGTELHRGAKTVWAEIQDVAAPR
jgi:anti-sigma regulatory factor (Ser/Thr protein kinase)